MPTKIGYVGSWNYYVGGNTEINRVPISTSNKTNYGWHDGPLTYHGYYTISQPQLQLDSDEYPTKIGFSDYSTYVPDVSRDGHWTSSDPGTEHTHTVTIGLFPGDATNDPSVLCNFLTRSIGYRAQDRITGTWNIPEETGKRMIGQKMNLRLANRGTQLWGYCKVTITTLKHAITWTNPSLSLSQNEYDLTITMGGSATDSWGGTPVIRLQMDGADLGIISDTKTITLTDDQLEQAHTFTLTATSSANGHTVTMTGCSVSYTPHSVHKTVKYWDGTAWVECYANVYDNGEWVEVEPFYYDGTGWVPCSQT